MTKHSLLVSVSPQAVYQRIIKLSYVDKLLDQVSLEFRDRYKNEVSSGSFRKVNFDNTFKARLYAILIIVLLHVTYNWWVF